MKPIKSITTLLLVSSALSLAAQTQYAAKITINTGNSFVVKKLNIQGDRLYSDSGQASTSISVIESVEFRFAGINLKMCESMFRSGDRKALENLLNQYVSPVVVYSHLPGNLGDYLVWLLRVQYWNDNPSGAGKTIVQLRKMANARQADAANLYFTLLLLDQGKTDNANTVFATVVNPEEISVPMAEHIRGRLAIERGDYRQTMQHISKILAFHSNEIEWLPPATALEARVYQETGQLKKAESVAKELIMAYPGTRWSKLGEKIKKEVQP